MPRLATLFDVGENVQRTNSNDYRSRILLLQNGMMFLHLAVGINTRHREAAPHLHIRLRLGHQRIPDILLTPRHPPLEALMTQRIHGHIHTGPEELVRLRYRIAHDIINVAFELLAVGFEREIVDVHAEGVFDFAADGGNAEDDVGGEDAAGDCYPAEIFPELEWQHHYVDPGNLGDGDGVGDWEGGLEDTFYADEDFV